MIQPRHWRYRNACRSSRITLQTFRSWAGSTTRARRFMPNNATSKTINAALLKRFGAEFEIDPELTGLNELEKIAGHRSHRRYLPRPIAPDLLSAPSKSDLQQCDIIIVSD